MIIGFIAGIEYEFARSTTIDLPIAFQLSPAEKKFNDRRTARALHLNRMVAQAEDETDRRGKGKRRTE